MVETIQNPQSAFKYEVQVRDQGWVEFQTPLARGARIVVFVIEEKPSEDQFNDLVVASESSLDFWDNPLDDEDWNNA